MQITKNDLIKNGIAFYDEQKRNEIFNLLYNYFVNREEKNREDSFRAINTIRSYIFLPSLLENVKDKNNFVRSYISENDIAKVITQTFDVESDLAMFDANSILAFKQVNFDEGQDSVEVVDVRNGVTFKQIREGEKVDLTKISAESTYIKAVYLGGGVEIPFRLFENRKFSQIVDLLTELRNAAYRDKYNYLYKLLVAGGTANTTINWQGTGTDPIAKRDILTLNLIASTLGQDNRYKSNAMSEILIYCHPNLEPRLRAAINYTTYSAGNIDVAITSRPIRIIPTYELVDANNNSLPVTRVAAVLPQRRVVYAEKIPLQNFTQQDIISFSQVFTARIGMAAAVADVKQTLLANFA